LGAERVVFCEKILGTLPDFPGRAVDYVTVEWHEIGNRVHRKMSRNGVDVAIRLGDHAFAHPLRQDDVLAVEDGVVFAVDSPPCEVLVIRVDPDHRPMAEKVCWETGNKHAPLFWGAGDGEFITPYDMPLEALLGKLHGVSMAKDLRKLDFSRAISASPGSTYGNTHSHTHEHTHGGAHTHHEH
jgi:urease accessory protein